MNVTDTMPLWFWLPLAVGALIAVTVIEFRASKRYWAEQYASDPVVVTGTRPSNRYPRSCGGVR